MNVKDRLVITDEELECADLQMLINWLPNYINNEHVNIHKWKNGRGWTIECKTYAVGPCEGRILTDVLRRFIKECKKLVEWNRLYVWPEDVGYGLLNENMYKLWVGYKKQSETLYP